MAELDSIEQVVVLTLICLYGFVVYYAYKAVNDNKDDFNKGEGKL